MVLEKPPEGSLDSKEIKPVNLKEDKPQIFTGRTDAEAPVFWSSDADNSMEKSQMLRKIEGRRRRQHQRMRWLDGITDAMNICCSVSQLCPTLCDAMDCSTPGFPVLHHLPELAQTHAH